MAGFSEGTQLYRKVSRRLSCTFLYLLCQMLASIESVTVTLPCDSETVSVILEYQIFLFLIFTSFINIISAPITRTNIDIDKLKIVLTSNFIHFYQEILSTFNCC